MLWGSSVPQNMNMHGDKLQYITEISVKTIHYHAVRSLYLSVRIQGQGQSLMWAKINTNYMCIKTLTLISTHTTTVYTCLIMGMKAWTTQTSLAQTHLSIIVQYTTNEVGTLPQLYVISNECLWSVFKETWIIWTNESKLFTVIQYWHLLSALLSVVMATVGAALLCWCRCVKVLNACTTQCLYQLILNTCPLPMGERSVPSANKVDSLHWPAPWVLAHKSTHTLLQYWWMYNVRHWCGEPE